MGCCSSRQVIEDSEVVDNHGEVSETHELVQNASIRPDSNTLCARCATVDWRDIGRQARSASTRQVRDWPPQDDVSGPLENGRPHERELLKIEASSLTKNCPVCLLFLTLVRKEELEGNKVDGFTFGREDEELFYGNADILLPRPYGIENYQIPGLSGANESWCSDLALGIAIQERENDSGSDRNISRALRKIDPAKININLLRNWISTCSNQHGKDCNPAESELVPSLRVIDVRTGIIEEAQPGCKYVALSYVWGSSQPPEKNSPDGKSRNLLDAAPETIKDAAWLTDELGYRYIWIDRYCIPQDDPQAKHDQIQKMDLVYQQAELTIIAAAGEGPEFGLPGVGHRRREAQLSAKVSRDTYLVSTEPDCQSFLKSKWITRGWTYQESVCSRRCVIFTTTEMLFQCKDMTCRETVHEPGNNDLFIAVLDNEPISLRGQELTVSDHIESYCRRQLTYDSDALNGILGILRLHRQSQNPVYHFWGIPFSANDHKSIEQSFLSSLCWESTIDPESTFDIKESRRQDFPSWSWTGWKTPIRRFFGPPNLVGSVSVYLNDGTTMGFQEAFERNMKIGEFRELSKFLDIECWSFELDFKFPEPNPDDETYSEAWVWPTGKPGLDDNSRVAMALDCEITPDRLPSNFNGPLLGLVFARRDQITRPTYDTQFAIVAMNKGDYHERIGYLKLDDNNLSRISTSTFKHITRNGSSVYSDDGELSLPSMDRDDEEGYDDGDGEDDYDDNDNGRDVGGGLGGMDGFYIDDWLPREFTWRRVKLG